MSCWEIRHFLFGISTWHAAIFICAMMQVCKTGCHIWILCVACDDGTLRQRQQNQPGKSSRCIYYIETWNQRGDFQPATLGGRRFFRGVSFRTGHPLPISMDFKGFPVFGQKPEGSQLPQTSQTLEFRNLRRWQCYIYIYQFPFNLQPPKTNGWTLKIAFGKFQPLVFGGAECIHQCSLDSLQIWNQGFWSCKGLAFTQGVVESMGLKEMPLDIFQVSSDGCCWK